MGNAISLKLDDVRAVLQLSGDLREASGDPDNSIQLVLQRLLKLTDARAAAFSFVSGVLRDRESQIRHLVTRGWDIPAERNAFAQYHEQSSRHLLHDKLVEVRASAEPLTILRQSVWMDEPWYDSSYVHGCCRPAGVDHCIISAFVLPRPGWVETLELYRAWGDPRPFTERERLLVHFVHCDLARLHRAHPAYANADHTKVVLTPRMQTVVECLLNGMSEKETGNQLGISVHTVHSYCVEIYRRHKVHSRAELMSYYLSQSNQQLRAQAVLQVQ